MKSADIDAFFGTLAAANPSPQTELEFTSVFELLIAVLLSAQATDVGVNKATRVLFARAWTPQRMLDLGLEGVTDCIRTIGAALESLPGVGRKTANVVLNVAFGEPTMAVDTHIFRVSNRTGLAPGKDVRAVENRLLLQRIPARWQVDAHHWLILHGRYVCKARSPECGTCTVRVWCDHGRRLRTGS